MKLYDRAGQVIGVIFDTRINSADPEQPISEGAGSPSPPLDPANFTAIACHCHACKQPIMYDPVIGSGETYVYRHDPDGWHHYHVACADKPEDTPS